jgi:hypothetical protein
MMSPRVVSGRPMGQRLDVGPQRAAQIPSAIGAGISGCVTPGQIDDVRGQLPDELRSILPGRPARMPADG